jgi:hypothetical protein
MSLESFAYIKDLVATNPLGTDPKSEGDDHLRGVKLTLKQQFSGFTQGKPITVTEDDVNSIPTLASRIWPIGCIYLSVTDIDPAITLGFGTWSRVGAGRMLMDFDTAYPLGSTGGAATHTLQTTEIPSHDHAIQTFGLDYTYTNAVAGQTSNVNTGTRQTQATGGGLPHNNLPPYVAICAWKRDA